MPDGISHIKHIIPGYKNDSIGIEIFSPKIEDKKLPYLLYLHGGAFALNAVDFHKRLMCDYALGASCAVVFVDYHLTPQYPYPYGIEDAYAAYLWLLNTLCVDEDQIAVAGDSAGGCPAAGISQMIHDRIKKTVLFQLLIYPVLDHRMETESMKQYDDTPLWDSKLNRKMWQMYLKNLSAGEINKTVSPILAESFANLPPTYIEVSEFDCLRDEGLRYYESLTAHGVDVVLNATKGTIHGFEYKYESPYTQEIIRQRIDYMKNKFKS